MCEDLDWAYVTVSTVWRLGLLQLELGTLVKRQVKLFTVLHFFLVSSFLLTETNFLMQIKILILFLKKSA